MGSEMCIRDRRGTDPACPRRAGLQPAGRDGVVVSGGLPRLMLLTDRSQLRLGRGLARTVEECVAAGLRRVVVREHDLERGAWTGLVDRLLEVPGLEVLTSRRAPPGAHGLHLAAHQRATTRRHGRSCHDRASLDRAAREGARWATLSPYAPSDSKPGHGPCVDQALFASAPLPTYALGGLTPATARAALEAGAHGVAVMGTVMRAADPAGETARLLEALGPEGSR